MLFGRFARSDSSVDRLRPLPLQHADEQLRRPVHRLRSCRLPLKLLFHER